jgi:hypothetical protein
MATLLTLTKADTGPLVVTVPWQTLSASNGLNPYHTGTGKLWFYGKLSVQDADAAAIFTKTFAAGSITVPTDGNNTTTNGVVNITLAPADTSALPDTPISVYCALKGFDGVNEYTITKDITLFVSAQATSKVS